MCLLQFVHTGEPTAQDRQQPNSHYILDRLRRRRYCIHFDFAGPSLLEKVGRRGISSVNLGTSPPFHTSRKKGEKDVIGSHTLTHTFARRKTPEVSNLSPTPRLLPPAHSKKFSRRDHCTVLYVAQFFAPLLFETGASVTLFCFFFARLG